MPIRLSPEEIASEFGGNARLADEPQAGWGTRFGAAVDRFQSGLYGVGEALTGSETLGRLRRENQAEADVNRARAIRDTGAVDRFGDIAGPRDLATYVGGLAVDSSPELASVLLSGGAGALAGLGAAGRVGLAAATSAPSAMGDILQNQREEAGKTDLLSAAALTAPYVAVDMLGLDAALASGRLARSGIKALDNMSGARGIAARSAVTFAKSAPAEGLSEMGQEFVNQAGRIAVNPDQTFFNPDANERYAESFAGGAMLGGVVSTGLGGWRRTNEPAATQTTQEVPVRVTPRLGFDPRAGQQTVFPDGSSIVSSEVEPLQTSTPEVAQALESHKAAQAQREIAATQSVAPPTPEQIEEEAAAQQQVQLAQEAMAFVQQAGIQAKNALPVVKEMLSAGDIVTPALRGAMRGALVTGDVNGARKMLVDAKKARDKAQAEAQKAQVAAQKAEQKIVEEGQKFEKANDEFAASVVARQTPPTEGTPANVPSPAQPGTQTSQAQSAQGTQEVAQPVEKTPGEKLVAGLEARAGKPLPAKVKRRIYLLAGLDPDEGRMVGSPKTLEQVAAIEAALDGTTKVVSREAIRKSLIPFGINQTVMDRLGEMVQVKNSEDTEVDENGTLADRVAPEDNTPVTQDEAFGAAMEDSGDDGSGMYVRSNLGSGIIEPTLTRSQRAAELEGNKLLANAAGAATKRGADAIERVKAAVSEATAPVVSAEQIAKNSQKIAENERLIAEMNAEVESRTTLKGMLPESMHDEIDRAAEDFDETVLDGDSKWSEITTRRQAQWVKAFVSWDTGNIDTRTFNKIFETIQDDTRREASQVRLQPAVPGGESERSGNGDVRQDTPRDDVRGASQAPGNAEPADRGASQATDGLDPESPNVRLNRTRNVVSLGNIKDNAGKQVAVIEGTLEEMERTPHIKAAFDKLRANGLGNVVDSVESWYVTENPVDWGGAYTVINGKTAIVMSSHDMLVPSAGEYTMLHELGHAADKTHEDGGGLYSGMPEFNLRIVGNQIRGHGIVADQVIAFYESNPNSWFSKRMQYPLDRKAHGDLDAQGVREEMFAQLHATFNTPVGKEFLYDNLPDVAYFLENVNADIAQNDTTAEGLAGATNAGAPSRFNQAKRGQEAQGSGVLATRPQGDRGQRASQVTNTYAFKRWFGDSKVVDAEGKPLVVYHGTSADFNEFDTETGRMGPGSWFTPDSRLASGHGNGGSVMPVYLSIKNPYTAKNATEASTITADRKSELVAQGYDGVYEKRGALEQWVAFRPEQIKSAIGNNGNFDPANPDIRFNRTRNIEAQLTPAARAAAGATKQFLKDVKDKSILWGAFTEDLINSISGKLPAAKRYLDLVKRGQVAKTRAERDIESILDRFATLSKVERGTGPSSVNAFLKESTTKKLWGYKPEYLENVQVDPEMESRFKALSPEARALVQEVFRHGHENLQQLKSAVMGNINTEFDALIAGYEAEGDTAAADKERKAKQKALRDFQSLTALSGDWPYAPLKRFGNHVVVGKSQAYLDAEERSDTKELEKLRADENHYFVAFTETKREARALRTKIEGRYADATNFEKDGVEYGSRDMLGAFRRLRTLVDDSKDDQLSGNAKRAMNRLMVDLHLTLLGEQSARQAERTRTGVAGADEDMMRAFATQGRASAHFIASLTNNGQIAEELRNLRNQADGFRGAEREGARDAYNEVLRRHAMGIDYRPTPFIDKALGANSVWMLLTSPAYFLTNATQPFVVSMPVLAGRNGYTRSFAAMSKAYADIAPLIKDGTITQDDYSRMPADVKGIIEELANRGRIDISLEQDLGRWRSDQDSKFAVFGKVVDKMRGFTQTVESVNRVATAIAAARLAKQNGMTDAEATQYADEVIFTTHGDYSGFNAPRVMRSGIGRMMTQFRKFQLIQISMYAKLLNSSLKGATPEERLVARRALAYSLTHMFALGGALGMPGAQAIGWVLRQAFGDDDEPDNPEVTLRKLVPPELADLLIKGAPAALGVDLSGRLGAGNMLSLLPYADIELSRSGYQTAAMAAMGPFFGGLLPKFADGLGLINQGDYWKGLEQLTPKGLSDVSKAVRQSTEGVTQRNGDIAMSADEVSFLATIGQAMGLPTTSMTERTMVASAKFKADEFFNKRTAQIKKEYVQAYRSGDNEALVQARDEWSSLQEARKEYGYKVQPMSELLKAPQAQVKREANRAGGVPYKKDNEQFVRSMTQ